MQIEDLVKAYQDKSDGELIQLAAASEQLTSEACVALQGELSRRRIQIAQDSSAFEKTGGENDPGKTTKGRLLEVEWLGVGNFLTEVLRTYHSHFRLYFQITAPAVIISTIAIIAARHEVREISRHLPRGAALFAHSTEILKIGILKIGIIN